MVAFVLVPVGLVIGVLAAPLAAPYVGEVPRRRRIVMGLVTAALFGLLGWRAGYEPVLPALLYLAAAGTLLGFIDVGVKRLPDRFTLPSYGVAAALLAAAAPFTEDGLRRFEHALIGMAALFAVYFAQALLVPSGIGMGDVKLSGVLGLYLGWFGQDAWLIGLLATYLLGGLVALGILIVRRSRKGEFPYGPYMLAGALAAILSAVG
ncbi:leader peptidase (prepilin peptidase)/N-methyltransferase [Actinomadura luteofluorescens]|uniref:Leader peptidase (Prepilin peptidase)/N-methyltransferase n=1 Tax=Actinomadura luteofluorescens TaxID=46163 RepID=A0A7Y9JGU1_9ACTN|nr:prepilin peptidase [Actinomadura luteofluorescens]NYD46659.1 leader peptidase (prepilin peptidase)/N-methyltransferase [Actinomadura luteofluorescens]